MAKVVGLLLVCAGWAQAADMRTYAVSCGQGDGLVIVKPSGGVIIVDGGPSSVTSSAFVQFLNTQGITAIDQMVLTHPHVDHFQGLRGVFASGRTVSSVYDPKMPYASASYEAFKTAVLDSGAPYIQALAGDVYSWDAELSIKVLSARDNVADANNASIALKVAHGMNSLLFTGDSPTSDAEQLMLDSYPADLPAGVLKVGHHGSRYSSSSAFLSAVAPAHALISCGVGNTYGHPHQECLDRLAAQGAAIYRTDTDGTILVVTDGAGTYTISTGQ